ncbi:methionyl-tRNA formyltransferase [uncultured Slackia sp.]|uniref:methionyl-tRNA formyltransferase n=1 Tax=uncultured Slackia sp. TaxID=665903 RepID=UPI0025D0D767|nr:methionyl-tRNA formyltransferase [uncultured Slackia sp.]
MRVVFMGTPDFAASILDELKEQHEVIAVYTQPDAVRGRGKKLVPSPVKELAQSAGIPVFQPTSLRTPEEQDHLREFAPDMICVAAYGKILPQEVLDIPEYGCLNVHASLLPKYRGAAPIERAILAGDEQTGVCIMRMEAGMDTGDYCICRSCDIGDMSCKRLTAELAEKGAYALLSAMYSIEQGNVYWTRQDESQVAYAPKIEKGELNCDPADTAVTNLRRVQASSDAHPSKCSIAGKGVTIIAAKAAGEDLDKSNAPDQGKVVFQAKKLYLGCADGPIEIIEIKPDGKKEMSAAAFASGVQGIKAGNVIWERM